MSVDLKQTVEQAARLLWLYENGGDVETLRDWSNTPEPIKERLRMAAHAATLVGLQDLLAISASSDLKIALDMWAACKPQDQP
jgi:hypothetical protein